MGNTDERDQNGKKRKKRRKKQSRVFTVIGAIFCTLIMLLQVAGGALLCLQLFELDLLPIKFLIVIGVVVLVMAAIQIGLIVQHSKPSFFISSILGICFTAIVVLGIFYVKKTEETLASITNTKVTTTLDEVSIAVLNDSPYEDLSDLNGTSIGVQASVDRTNTDKTMDNLKQLLADDLTVTEHNGVGDMVQALYDGQDQVIVFNEAYRALIIDAFETFEDDVRVLTTYTYTGSYVEQVEDEDENDVNKVGRDDGGAQPVNVELETEPFVLYFSGIDTYGEIGTKSRSDVNIIGVINPATKQILLVTTPRDYYVPLALNGNPMDKLTHAGIYGIDCSIKTLENLYGITINYYMRVNFTGFIDIVNALGGVDVESEQSFTGEAGGFSYTKGINHVNGEQALCFVRERHTFQDGDAQRARNQMAMIEAVLKKASSPSILTSYSSVLDSVSNAFMTSMTKTDISTLVKMQLDQDIDWDVHTYSTNGFAARRTTYSMGSQSLYVALQDSASVQRASELMQQVIDGEIIEIEETEAADGANEEAAEDAQ